MYTNIEAAEELAKLYVDIPIERIEKEWCEDITACHLTGFGKFNTCHLCRNVNCITDNFGDIISYFPNCKECIWSAMFPKNNNFPCMVDDTYWFIKNATSPKQLKEAFMERAKLLTAAIELAKKSNKVCCNEN